MKKLRNLSATMLVLLLAIAPIHAQIVLIPEQYDFGEVSLGESASTIITISNTWWGNLTLENTQLLPGGGSFTLVNVPPSGAVVPPGSSLLFGIEFSPNSEGFYTATVEIQWANGESGTSRVEVSGTGVHAQSPQSTIEGIINFFDTSVANGSLVGAGPGKSATNRLNVVRKMLVRAGYLLGKGNYKAACGQLGSALKRCNEFVQGDAQNDLIEMLLSLMYDLGC